MSFWSELRRRKVVRATLAYLAAAFVAAQVTQLLTDALDLPKNILSIVVIVEIALLPLVIAAAWAFDWSSEGVHQTDSPAAPFRWRRIAPAALATVVLLSAGLFFTLRRPEADLDANLVAVLPFRVSGSNDIAYLREGMMDLLSAKLTGEGGPRAADPRSTMSALKAGGHDGSEITDDDAREVARKLGAAQLLLGSVVGTAHQLTINATLSDVRSGKQVRVERTGSADTLAAFIDHLAAELLSLRAGEDRRLASLTSTSLPALRAYLAAQSDYRGARFDDAQRNYQRALQLDSTFALAAMGHFLSTGWRAADDTTENRSRRLLVRYADRLGGLDRAMARAMVGTSYPDERPRKEVIDAWEAIITEAPDRSEAWFLYGDIMLHQGAIAGHRDNFDKSRRAMNRSLQLDSAHTPALVHLIDFAIINRDTAALRKLNAVRASNRVPPLDHQMMPLHRLLGDSAGLGGIRAAMDTMSYNYLYGISLGPIIYGTGFSDALRAIDLMVAGATLASEQRVAYRTAQILYLAYGKQQRAAEMMQRRIDGAATGDVVVHADAIMDALYGDGDTVIAVQTVERIRKGQVRSTGTQQMGLDCAVDMWDLWRGGGSRALQTARALHQVPRNNEDYAAAKLCALILEALHANLNNTPNATTSAQALDEFLGVGPVMDGSFIHVGNIVAARLWERRGDRAAAYRAISRRGFHPSYTNYFPVMVGEQARLAALIGETREAAHLYNWYLDMRAQGDPALRPKVDAARREMSRLTRDQRAN